MNIDVFEDSIHFSDDDQEVAVITEKLKDKYVNIRMKGSFRSSLAYFLTDELNMLIVAGYSLELDMSETTYLSNTAAYALYEIELQVEKRKKTLHIQQMPRHIYDDLREVGYHALLDIEVMK